MSNRIPTTTTITMSAPTVTSLATDKTFDQAMGWGSQTSGGRGKRGYEMQLTRRQQEKAAAAQKVENERAKAQQKENTKKVTELLRKADAGELDWM